VLTAATHVSSFIRGLLLSLHTFADSVDIKGLDLNSGYGRVVLDGFHFDVSEVTKERS
jgi:hypothetical protein